MMRTWVRALVTALVTAAAAGAGQLGLAYGLGIMRWDQQFTNQNMWSAQLTWSAWIAAVAVVAGAVSGVASLRRHGHEPHLGSWLGASLAAAGGGLLTVATVFSILVLGSHYPSDIVGGLLVATAWASVATAVLRLELKPSLGGAALGAFVLAAAGAFVVALRPADALAYAAANTTFVVGALAIAAGALVLSGSVPAPTGAQRRPRSPRARG